MSTLNGQELEIFRAGDYGAKGRYTPEELQQLASDYDPAQHEAPIVVGHPKTDAPAFGWWKSLRAEGGKLFGTPHQVPAEFDAAVEAGRFKKRSVAITRKPDGKLMLRHVGFLGAMVPGVLGMPDAKFGEEDFEEIEFDSTPGDSMPELDKKTIADTVREVFADIFGGGKDKNTQVADIAALEQRLTAKFADDLKKVSDAHDATKQEFADYKAKAESGDKSQAAKAAVAKLKSENKWLPAFDRMGVPELFAAIGESTTVEIEFADTKETKKKLSPMDALSGVLASVSRFVPRGVEFDSEKVEVAPAVKDVPAGTDPGSAQFDAEVKARMEKDKVDYLTATRRLVAEGKSSESYGAARAGAV